MEAWRFGFDPALPAAYKFDPTDADLVAHYLLPRALGIPGPHEHAVVDDDPASCPPWELLRRHGHAGSSHAFFFGPPRARARRAVPAGDYGPGGTWRGQKSENVTLILVRGGGGDGGAETMELTYKRFNLTFYSDGDGGDTTSGWVMHEYRITDPPLSPGAMLARVKITDKAKKDLRQLQQEGAAAEYQDQPGPSNYVADGHAAGNALASGSGDGGEASSSGAHHDGVAYQGDSSGLAMGEAAAGYYMGLPVDGEGGC